MPVSTPQIDYQCLDCKHRFSRFNVGDAEVMLVACPKCGSGEVEITGTSTSLLSKLLGVIR
ncbi:FmdB family zinc ribbon protein [Parathalassolituus penaei]|uniref:Zinc ribbon domain-containing protein n=1 Tax=Parathalassolituus penaei TaxID=2997323 RepID=A0A9X3ECP4_9GAMM|nr:zinc ribbon domain-containing protein [Parathalassolituus penaei]MCY0965178.1 zinc ribbon domain-containing protein [Parathalassolituus penaei]